MVRNIRYGRLITTKQDYLLNYFRIKPICFDTIVVCFEYLNTKGQQPEQWFLETFPIVIQYRRQLDFITTLYKRKMFHLHLKLGH